MYLENSISYRKVISVVPTVWKRLIVTFLWVFILIFAYHAIAILFFHLIYENFPEISFVAFVLVVVLVWFAFFCIHVYISCIWHLSSVITVLEDSYGLRALLKSVELIKGNRRVAIQLFIVYLGLVTLISFVFHGYVLGLLIEDGAGSSLSLRLLLGTALVALFTFVTLYGMLAQTVFYFACKAFHNEQIDWVALSDHLAAYMGEYVQLKSAIQMESV
ncbi:hypothetical protein KP509_07G078000 [Ceratopteris richardii]|nr:hypothetical protein KP509_07G078000 [Ceratopteris richardii]